MQKYYKIKKAFSLLEISVVILVIGILISGISTGIDLYQEYKITSARNYTINSKVSRIPDIGFWMDTTRLKSLETASGSFTPKNGDKIKNWYSYFSFKTRDQEEIIANQNNASLQPIYIENGLGGLPSLWFEEHPTNGGKGLDITINSMFRSERYIEIYFALKGNGVINTYDPIIGSYQSWCCGWSAVTYAPPYYSPRIYTWNYWCSGGCWQNRGTSGVDWGLDNNNLRLWRVIISNSSMNVTSLTDNRQSSYGGNFNTSAALNIGYQTFPYDSFNYTNQYFNGEISEIIYFRRNLNDSERSKVNEYFKEKYKLKF
jgi:prepilin-type N-terminal cleavage/methylation domain-containing protein